jgi:transporter family protein
MGTGILFAVIAACLQGCLMVFQRLAAPFVDKVAGAILISLTGVLLGLSFLPWRGPAGAWFTNPRAIVLLVAAGGCVLGIDYSVLRAYAAGLPVSIGGPVIIGGSILVTSVAGVVLGEPITLVRVLAISMIAVGSVILSGTSIS